MEPSKVFAPLSGFSLASSFPWALTRGIPGVNGGAPTPRESRERDSAKKTVLFPIQRKPTMGQEKALEPRGSPRRLSLLSIRPKNLHSLDAPGEAVSGSD